MYPVNPKEKTYISLDWGFQYPNKEPYLSWGLAGAIHKGVDFGRSDKTGKTTYYIVAPVGGRVKLVDLWKPPVIGTSAFNQYINKHPFGNLIILESNESDGPRQHYLAHLWKVFVTVNRILKKGEVLGIMGTTGKSTGIHLHYGVKSEEGQWINPMEYIT